MKARRFLLSTVCSFAALGALGLPCAAAEDDAIDSALDLADATKTEARAAADWKLNVEGAYVHDEWRSGGHQDGGRLSLDYRLDTRFAEQWRAVLADRLDAADPYQFDPDKAVNVLKEAYVSWQPQPDRIVDLGRVNLRVGAGQAYNPTDFFRANAIRSLVSFDPESKRNNRLGTVMLRGQMLSDRGSLALLVAPKITGRRSTDPLSPDWGATNPETRWQLTASHRFADNFNPQVLVYGEKGKSPQLGLNLSVLATDAIVAYGEYAGGRVADQRSLALGEPEDRKFRSRAVLGATWTLPIKLSITAEVHYDEAALSKADWRALPANPPAFGQYLQWTSDQQELASRRAAFVRAAWTDAFMPRLDLTGFVLQNLDDRSRQIWGEVRYRFDHYDVALQGLAHTGRAGSQFGVLNLRRQVQLLANAYF